MIALTSGASAHGTKVSANFKNEKINLSETRVISISVGMPVDGLSRNFSMRALRERELFGVYLTTCNAISRAFCVLSIHVLRGG